MNSLMPELLTSVSSLLYGDLWQQRLSRELQHPDRTKHPQPGIDSSSIRRWLSTSTKPGARRRIPAWVGPELYRLVRERLQELETVNVQLESCLPVEISIERPRVDNL